MKLLALLLVTLVAGYEFNQPIWPRTTVRPSWRTGSSPAVVQPFGPVRAFHHPHSELKIPYDGRRTFASEFERALEDDDSLTDPVEDRRVAHPNNNNVLSSNKYFLFDDEAHAVQSFSVFDPFNFFNTNPNSIYHYQPFQALTKPAFARRTVSKFITVTSTVITPVVSICISSNLFATPTNPTSCVRRRRHILEQDYSADLSPTPVSKELVETTKFVDLRKAAVQELESSKDEPQSSELQPSRVARGRINFRVTETITSTVTVYAFSPTVIKKPITPVNVPQAGAGALLCIPPGITVC